MHYHTQRFSRILQHHSQVLFGQFVESQSRDFKEAIDEEKPAEEYGYSSDSDLEDDEDEKSSFEDSSKPKIHPFDLFPIPGEDVSSCEKNEECVGKGKVVKIPDMAFVTWVKSSNPPTFYLCCSRFQAFLMYLYTNAIEFAPFGSEEGRRSRSAEIVDPFSDDKVPRPSPKSIYRLADKVRTPSSQSTRCIRGLTGLLSTTSPL